SCPALIPRNGTTITQSTTALIRYGEYRRIRGAITTEKQSHDADSASASRSPPRSDDRLPPDPSATRATPPKPTAVASQNEGVSRSTPSTEETIAAKIGVVPMISETVVAVVSFSEYTNEIWLTSRKTAAIPISTSVRLPPTVSERSST